jgi:hypothetical protein
MREKSLDCELAVYSACRLVETVPHSSSNEIIQYFTPVPPKKPEKVISHIWIASFNPLMWLLK